MLLKYYEMLLKVSTVVFIMTADLLMLVIVMKYLVIT